MKIFNRNHIVSIEIVTVITPKILITFSNGETKKKEFVGKTDLNKYTEEIKKNIDWI
tara:strand:+ start:797 stop:967 length:171 start_codon:yes stop_codon:yes gene_type:complete